MLIIRNFVRGVLHPSNLKLYNIRISFFKLFAHFGVGKAVPQSKMRIAHFGLWYCKSLSGDCHLPNYF
jgi:hypothetical protein